MALGTNNLIQNNIWQHVTGPTVVNGPATGDVFGYNFSIDDSYTAGGNAPSWMQPTHTWHEVGTAMELYEGNSGLGLDADNIHGTHHFGTFFRNYYYGDIWNNPPKSANTYVLQLEAFSRFFNFVGNVLGRVGYYTAYENGGNVEIYNINGDQYFGAPYGADPRTRVTSLRWGNYDNVTGAVRWCGNASDTGWATTCSSKSEVPAALSSYSNPVPSVGDTGIGQGALPSSFYLSNTPSWWVFPSGSTTPFPGIGPDVTGGQGLGGHAYYIPAENCWRNVMGGVIGSSGLLSFDADTCYGSTGNGAPAPPTGLDAQIQ
jgi:hypothetical protein